jgi:hypothetical protein
MWSSSNLASYLALTAHWIAQEETTGRLTLKSALIAFHRVKVKHTGNNIARALLYLFDRANVTLNVSSVACIPSRLRVEILFSLAISHSTMLKTMQWQWSGWSTFFKNARG